MSNDLRARTDASTAPDTRPRLGADAVLRWAPVAIMGLAPVAIAARALRPVTDPDTFWHLHTGQFLWDTWQFSGPEPWSHFSSRPFVLHEWLPELGYALAVRLGGMGALSWVEAVTAGLLLVAVYLCCRLHASPLVAAAVAGLGLLGASGSLAARPQIVSYLLVAVTTTTWLRTAADRKPRWWLVPLTWVWACSHGLWIAGPLIGTAFVAGLWLERPASWRALRRLALIPVLSLAVAALTPVGPRLLLVPFEVSGYAKYVSEWRAATLSDPWFLATLALAATCVVVWTRSRTRVSFAHLACLALAIGWALLYARTVALGAMMLAPLTAIALESLLPHGRPTVSRRAERRVLVGGVAAMAALTALLVPTHTQGVGPLTPGGLDGRLAALPRDTVIYNQYGTGGWLMLMHPNLAPVVDERTEVYSEPYLDAYFASLQVGPTWAGTVSRSGATVALLPDDSPLSAALVSQLKWRPKGHDRGFVLLTAPGAGTATQP